MIKFFENVGKIARLIAESIYHVVRGDVEFKNTTQQMVSLGVRSIPLVLIISGFTGMVFSLQVAQELKRFGAESFIGQLLGLAIIRELGAVLTGVVVAGRAGSAIAAELGAMKVTEQIDALEAMATSPVQYLVAPPFDRLYDHGACLDGVRPFNRHDGRIRCSHQPSGDYPHGVLPVVDSRNPFL